MSARAYIAESTFDLNDATLDVVAQNLNLLHCALGIVCGGGLNRLGVGAAEGSLVGYVEDESGVQFLPTGVLTHDAETAPAVLCCPECFEWVGECYERGSGRHRG